MMSKPLLQIKNLGVTFHTHHGIIEASQQINITLEEGDILGIVGESGSGKSVSMMAVARLLPEYAEISGEVIYDQTPIHTLSDSQFMHYRGKKILYLFQDPLTALNPYMRVGKQLIESIKFHQPALSKNTMIQTAHTLLEKVDLSDTDRIMHLYPHQCSGGMRQRILLALALTCKPKILIADEPTSALDAISAAQIIQLLHVLKESEQLSIIIISHDLHIVRSLCNRIAVFYEGSIVESNTTQLLISEPQHPYTKKLLDALHQME